MPKKIQTNLYHDPYLNKKKTFFLQGIIYILRFLFTYSKIVTSVARCLKSKAKHVYLDVMFAFH